MELYDLSVFGPPGPEQEAYLSELFMGMLGLEKQTGGARRHGAVRARQMRRMGKLGPLRTDLIRRASSLGLKGLSRLRKEELVKAIRRAKRRDTAIH